MDGTPQHDVSRGERAREWQLTALTALVVASAMFAWAAVASPPWDTGDVSTGFYFGLVSVALWIQAMRIQFAATAPPFTRTTRALLIAATAIGALLGAVDIASGGTI